MRVLMREEAAGDLYRYVVREGGDWSQGEWSFSWKIGERRDDSRRLEFGPSTVPRSLHYGVKRVAQIVFGASCLVGF
jgi:hypothetical protein